MPKKKSAKPVAKGATGRMGVRAAGDSPIRTVFYGSSAYVGALTGERKVQIWVEDPIVGKFKVTQEFPVDLDLCPSRLSTADRAKVQVDDGVYAPSEAAKGSTTIGPTFPAQREGAYVGAAYISDVYRAAMKVKGIDIPNPPEGYEEAYGYEFQVAWYWPGAPDPRAGRRYFGLHATVLRSEGSLALCEIQPCGAPHKQGVTIWVDLKSPIDCDFGPDSLTHLDVAGQVTAGSLFLGEGLYTPLAPLLSPKIPKVLGE